MAKFNDEQLKKLRECFEKYDADKSGAIDRTEIKNVLQALGINKSDDELNELFKNVDKDNSGSIEWDEFVNLMEHVDWSA